MLEALKSLRQRADGEQRKAIIRLMRDNGKQKVFRKHLMEDYGWDGSTLAELFKILLDNLPQILALILQIMK